jgi:hypothetical protein
MIDVRVLLLSVAVLTAVIRPSEAGPCTAELHHLRAQLNAELDATASAGPVGRESVAAKLHHQPTPGSLGHAEERLGEGFGLKEAAAALQSAQDLEQAGDRQGCHRALVEARRALGL